MMPPQAIERDRATLEDGGIAVSSGWAKMASFLILGYFVMGRTFAYLGIPPLHIFIGEIVLGWFLLFGPETTLGQWPWRALKNPVLSRYAKLLLAFLGFGVIQVVHGIVSGHPLLNCVRDLAFNYYPIYFFLGLWVGRKSPRFLPKFFRLAAWVNGVYGVLFVLVLSRIPWTVPGVSNELTPVPFFGQPSFSAVIILGLLSFEKDLRRAWPLLLMNAAVLVGMLIRAEWLAFVVGLLVWAWATRNLKRVALSGALILVLFGLMYITNFTFEGPESRGGTISATELVARVIAPVNPELAADYSDDVHMYEGTAAWRTMWWIEIWNSAHSSSSLALFGHGYGFALGDLVAYLEDSSTRTPHNAFFLALGYTGWSGVIMFALLQSEIARLCWRAYRRTNQAFSIVFWVTTLAFSFFTPFFETPQGAIPFYLVAGCACAGLLADKVGLGGFRGLQPSPGPCRHGIDSFPHAVEVGGAG
jgi:hypothetical protein